MSITPGQTNLYQLEGWVPFLDTCCLGCPNLPKGKLNDDRFGRVLEKVAQSWSGVSDGGVEECDLRLDRIHSDSTPLDGWGKSIPARPIWAFNSRLVTVRIVGRIGSNLCTVSVSVQMERFRCTRRPVDAIGRMTPPILRRGIPYVRCSGIPAFCMWPIQRYVRINNYITLLVTGGELLA